MVELLGNEGLEVFHEEDSGRGVAQVMQLNPGIILMSENMDSVNGVEVIPLLRRMTSAPIITLGAGGETAIVTALLQGADMYVNKPFNPRELVSRVRALYRRTESASLHDTNGLQQTEADLNAEVLPLELR